jgi:hypothetical protein
MKCTGPSSGTVILAVDNSPCSRPFQFFDLTDTRCRARRRTPLRRRPIAPGSSCHPAPGDRLPQGDALRSQFDSYRMQRPASASCCSHPTARTGLSASCVAMHISPPWRTRPRSSRPNSYCSAAHKRVDDAWALWTFESDAALDGNDARAAYNIARTVEEMRQARPAPKGHPVHAK